MMQINSINSSQNSFSFDIQTSSGDHISLSMYDDKRLEYDMQKNEDSKSISLTLRHEIGYRFHYDGNGIDAKDKKEIEEAMKIIRPIYKKFLKNIQKNDIFGSDSHIVNISTILKNVMPKRVDQNYLKDKTIDTMDQILKEFEKSDKLIKETKKLFDRLFDNSKGFQYYI